MAVADKLLLLKQDIDNARTAITTKGGTVTTDGGSSQLATDIATIPSGGGEETDIVMDFSNYEGSLGAGAFRPSADARWGCLKRVNMPKVPSTGNYCFYSNTSLEKVELPACTSMGLAPFFGCSNLEYLDCSSLTTLSNDFAAGCTKLTTLLLPFGQITGISSGAFSNTTMLEKLNFTAATSIMGSAFQNASGIKYLNLPLCQSVTDYSMREMTSLETLYMPSLTSITQRYSFYGNSSQEALILKEICSLESTNAFGSNNCLFYVPSSLVNTYKSATNWSSLASRIFGYEQETSVGLGETFTPNPAATVTSWDYISVNGAECTQDSSTGAITITNVGVFEGTDESSHILVRGLDGSSNPVYCGLVHISQEVA